MTYTPEQMSDLASVYAAQTLVKDDRTEAMLRQGADAVAENAKLREAIDEVISRFAGDGHEGQQKDCWMCILAEKLKALAETKP